MSADRSDFWTKLEKGLTATAVSPTTVSSESPGKSQQTARNLPRASRLLDAIATAVWIYLLLKVLVADVDRLMVESVIPSMGWIVNYRVVLYLALVAAMAATFRRRGLAYAYVVCFPVVVVGWKIPRFFYRRRSWPLFLGTLQAVVSVSNDIKYNVMTKAIALIATVLILFTSWPPLTLASAAYLAALLSWSFYRTFRRTFTGTPFTMLQQNWIRRLSDSRLFESLLTIKDEYKRADVIEYATADAN